MLVRILACLLLTLGSVQGARILGLFPMPVKSHMIISSAYMRGLASRGHKVVVFSPYPEDKPVPNYTDVEYKVVYSDLTQGSVPPDWFAPRKTMWHLDMVHMLWGIGINLCDKVFQDKFVQDLLNSKEKQYDLVVIGSFMTDCLIGIAHKLDVPVVQLCSFVGSKWMDEWVGNPSPYAYVPDVFQDMTDRMTFWQRVKNTLSELYYKIGRQVYVLPAQDRILKKYLNYTQDLPSITEMEKSIALLLVNGHFSISYPRPLMPNLVQVGGLHVGLPKNLPEDLQTYLDDSPNGVIYFSMGSNLRSSNFPEIRRRAFLEAFSKLKQKVLWKWETDTLPGQPSNVKLGKWLPQSDILAHPNVKLFITHGGLLSTQETTHRGVPVVGIPIYGDQRLNMARTVSSGLGVQLDFQNITVDSLLWAINEVLLNPKYQNNARRMSRIFRDQPLTPLEQAVFWTEYVIRHKGAPHMRSAALDLSWYQYFLLDVIAVLALTVGSVLLLLFIAIRKLCRICGRIKKIDKKKKHD